MDQTLSKIAGRRPRKGQEERRAAERHVFCETAEVLDVAGGNRLMGRISDISLQGCYVDTFNPFPLETLVRLKINKNGAEFVATGAVRNSQSGMGMGIDFAELSDSNRDMLAMWIRGGRASSAASPATESVSPSPAVAELLGTPDTLTRRLIYVLHRKGHLSDRDVDALLSDETP